ncbi:hypothetical protein AN399_24060 [Pseudomonas aeruginosa]|nr:hypothetical protein AN399_24060 [Pseudomonas aeruginosa]
MEEPTPRRTPLNTGHPASSVCKEAETGDACSWSRSPSAFAVPQRKPAPGHPTQPSHAYRPSRERLWNDPGTPPT